MGKFAQEGCGVITPSGFRIHRGVNISHWLSQTISAQRNSYFNDDDLLTIKSLGFDHVRIPIDEHELWNDEGLIIGKSFLMLKKCLDLCMRHSLKAVVVIKRLRCATEIDEHTYSYSNLWNNFIAQENLKKLWRNLSDFLKDYPRNTIAYELLNEPDAPTPEQWNTLWKDIMEQIRMREPERTIIIGSNMQQSESSVSQIEFPQDPNCIISIRFFKPFGFTHYRAEWTPLREYQGPVQYPGVSINPDYFTVTQRSSHALQKIIEQEQVLCNWNKQLIYSTLQPVAEHCAKYGVGLYCSQFGCLPSVPAEMRAQYYSDIVSCFQRLNMAYAYWDFKGRFGVMNKLGNNEFAPDESIIDSIQQIG